MHAVTRSIGFLALTLLFGAPLAGLYALTQSTGQVGIGVLVLVAYMFTPCLAAVILARRAGVPLRQALGLHAKKTWWWAGVVGFPLGLIVLTAAFSLMMPGASFSPDMAGMLQRHGHLLPPEQLQVLKAQLQALPSPLILIPLAMAQGVVAGATINAVAAFGEEAGWRGWLYRELRPLGFWTSSLVVGTLWGLWHAPLILQGYNYPEHPLAGVGMMTAMCIGVSPAMTMLRDKTDSVASAAMFHGVFNATAALSLLYVAGGSDLTVGVTGAAGLLTLATMNLGVWWLGSHEQDSAKVPATNSGTSRIAE